MSADKITVVIVDDHHLLRSGLKAMLDLEDDIEVVAEGSDGEQAIELYETWHPDVLAMDITMPKMGGIEASRIICKRHPEARILVMTQHEEPQFIEALVDTEVSGCIGKRAAGGEFVTALHAVHNGEFYLHPAMARLVARQARKRYVSPGETLTPREREILQAIVDGCTNTQIAHDMSISVKTVE